MSQKESFQVNSTAAQEESTKVKSTGSIPQEGSTEDTSTLSQDEFTVSQGSTQESSTQRSTQGSSTGESQATIRSESFKVKSSITPHKSTHSHTLFASQPYTIPPSATALISLRTQVSFPPSYYLFLASICLPLVTTSGVVDSDYRGDLGLIVYNAGEREVRVGAMQAVGEGVFFRIVVPDFEVVDELDESVRGCSGFGSTRS